MSSANWEMDVELSKRTAACYTQWASWTTGRANISYSVLSGCGGICLNQHLFSVGYMCFSLAPAVELDIDETIRKYLLNEQMSEKGRSGKKTNLVVREPPLCKSTLGFLLMVFPFVSTHVLFPSSVNYRCSNAIWAVQSAGLPNPQVWFLSVQYLKCFNLITKLFKI